MGHALGSSPIAACNASTSAASAGATRRRSASPVQLSIAAKASSSVPACLLQRQDVERICFCWAQQDLLPRGNMARTDRTIINLEFDVHPPQLAFLGVAHPLLF